MTLTATTDPATISARLDAVLTRDPLRNTVFSSVERGLTAPDAAPWAAHPAERPLVLAARSQAGTPVSLTVGWTGQDADELSDALAQLDPPPAAVMGPQESVRSIRVPGPVVGRRDERLFRLDRLVAPTAVAGSARLALEADHRTIEDWFRAFRLESFGSLPVGYDARAELAQRWPIMRIWLSESADAVPVSMAFAQPSARGVARVGPVYTPPDLRGYGFGSASTAAASQDILGRPATPCLFTDLANPTSNKIYRAIGYEEVADFTELRLH